MNSIEQFDIDCLKTARGNLMKPLNYYYGDSRQQKFWRRLETIVGKLDELIKIAEDGRNEELQNMRE